MRAEPAAQIKSGLAMSDAAYALGDSDQAAERLKVAARLFEPEMTRVHPGFNAPSSPRCRRPGLQPRLHHPAPAAVLGRPLTAGVDRSEHFLRLAADSAPRLRFVRHDLTEGPPPIEPADLVLCHLLLSHLPDPARTIESWKGCMTPAGVILVDEVDSIHTDDVVFVKYLGLVEAAIASRGGEFYVGRRLASVRELNGLRVRSNRLAAHAVAAKDAAAMFGMTLITLRENPAVQASASPEELAALADALHARTRLDGQQPVAWSMRQTVFEHS